MTLTLGKQTKIPASHMCYTVAEWQCGTLFATCSTCISAHAENTNVRGLWMLGRDTADLGGVEVTPSDKRRVCRRADCYVHVPVYVFS